MHKFLLLLILSLAECVYSDNSNRRPVLDTHIGKFYGTVLEFEGGIKVDAFYGVPYAKPPVGELRFEKPQDADYVEERNAATRPKACIQKMPWKQSEDCLYMNVYRPHEQSPTGYPAFFFIHGGGYQMGSAEEHTKDYVAEHYAGSGITVLIPQYRLNFYGFATTKTPNLPGNLALHDLHLALQFTHKYAKSLFIDPSRITVAGYSAGSSAASALSISPLTHDKFSQVLQFSGSTLTQFAFSRRGYEKTLEVLKILKCDENENARECLKSKSVEQINSAVAEAHSFDGESNHFDYQAVVDNDFFPADPEILISQAKPKVTMNSMNENEGLLFSIFFSSEVGFNLGLTKEQKEKFTVDDFKKFIRRTVVEQDLFKEEHEAASEEVIDFYLNTLEEDKHTTEFYLHLYAKALGDIMFHIPQGREISLKHKAGWPIYNIMSTYAEFNRRMIPGVEICNATHGTEYRFLFGEAVLLPHTELNEEDEVYRKLLIDSVVNFIKTGSPKSAENQNFELLSKDHPYIYTDISTEAVVKEPYYGRELEFWNKLTQKYTYDAVRGQKSIKPEHFEL